MAFIAPLSLFSDYPLLDAYLLTTYTYKHMHLLTRVYGSLTGSEPHTSNSISLYQERKKLVHAVFGAR